jgi:hypothetical protein
MDCKSREKSNEPNYSMINRETNSCERTRAHEEAGAWAQRGPVRVVLCVGAADACSWRAARAVLLVGGADVSSSSRQARGAERVGAVGAARRRVGGSKQVAVVGEEE